MIRTLDKYVIGNFIFTALLFFAVGMSLRVVSDLFANMDEFAKQGKSFTETLSIIGTYYGYQSLVYLVELGGVIIVAAAAFTLARMNHTNELTATLAAGVSLHRVIWPIVLCAMLLGGIIVVDKELVIPRVAHKLVRSRDDVPGTTGFMIRAMSDKKKSVLYSKRYIPAEKVCRYPHLWPRNEDYKAIGQIRAKRGYPGELDGRNGWFFVNGHLWKFGGEGHWQYLPGTKSIYTGAGPAKLLSLAGLGMDSKKAVRNVLAEDRQYNMELRAERFSPSGGGRLTRPRFTFRYDNGQLLGVITAKSAVWDAVGDRWRLSGGEIFYPSDLTPKDVVLRHSSRWLDYMSTEQIGELLRREKVSDRRMAAMIKHVRITEPINNLVMLLVGLPFILSRERNIKTSAGMCLLSVGAFYIFVYMCRYIALPPILSAWLPILVFAPIAVLMLDSVKT